MLTIKQIEEIASQYHFGQKDKNNQDYILHPIRVKNILANNNHGYIVQAIALLHDTLEDTLATPLKLHEQGIDNNIIYSVMLLTKAKEDKGDLGYFRYIQRLLTSFDNKAAIYVKLADLEDNLNRMNNPNIDLNFKRKYTYRYTFTQNILKQYLNER